MNKTKSFTISKHTVWEAWKSVKVNKGTAGIDEQTIQDFEENCKDNLYKLWNRMSSGSYFPPATRIVEIPKKDGGQRKLGIPTVTDRIAQMVAKRYCEPQIEPHFHKDSYGYRPNKSAIQAIGVTRKRCWKYNWVLDMDIQKCFDMIDHTLLMKAVKKHTQHKWIRLYVERWLKAPIQKPDGRQEPRQQGVSQGGVMSPLLANLFLHYAFDKWMQRNYPSIPFERYADDVIAHCKSEKQARMLLQAIKERLEKCGLKLHPDKTRIVYCKDDNRKENYLNEKFDFLGYTFRPRKSKNRQGKYFISFSPAVSQEATKRIRQEMRTWRVHLRSDKSLEDISHMFNPIIRGWINYYTAYYKSELYSTLRHFDWILMKWATRKYKKLRGHRRRACHWLGRIAEKEPYLFAHWQMGIKPAAGR
ncbi:group II intron reverse transcriptase/maturase [Patescibacteria group bacterium AH-259-L07]|nr:group II intron reverse transcriptase/maturase [Patescibacteria group bacterium AH-259-L07]